MEPLTKRKPAYQPSSMVECNGTLKRRIHRLQNIRDRGTSDETLEYRGAAQLRHHNDHSLSGLSTSFRDAHQMLGTDLDILTLQITTRFYGSNRATQLSSRRAKSSLQSKHLLRGTRGGERICPLPVVGREFVEGKIVGSGNPFRLSMSILTKGTGILYLTSQIKIVHHNILCEH